MLRKPSRLKAGYSYYLLKIDESPHTIEENENGGRWVVEITRGSVAANFSWLTLVLSLLLNRFRIFDDDIVGGVIEVFRKSFQVLFRFFFWQIFD